MRTRQKSRKNIDVPGRYLTGSGAPVDVILLDISEGGCRFATGSAHLTPGSPIQIFVGSSGPYNGTVRWIDKGEAGVNFATPFAAEKVEQFRSYHVCELPKVTPLVELGPKSEPAAEEEGESPIRRFC